MGDRKASSRTELKTLEPHWNETVAFSAADVAEGLAAGRPYVSLRVFDWDLVGAGVAGAAPCQGAGHSMSLPRACLAELCRHCSGRLNHACPEETTTSCRLSVQVSADDFLGQCELEFASLADVTAGGATPGVCWLPLYGFARGGRRVEAGEIQVAAWFEAAGSAGEHGEPGRPPGAAPRRVLLAPRINRMRSSYRHVAQGSC